MNEDLIYPLDHQCLVDPKLTLFRNTKVGENVKIYPFGNIYDSNLGDGVVVGPFCEIGGAIVGRNSRVQSHSYLCPGVQVGEETFIGHGVMTTNDLFSDVPEFEKLEDLRDQWVKRITLIGNRVRIGSGATILPCKIGDGAIVGAGSVVISDVNPGEIVAGRPAKVIGHVNAMKEWGFS